LKTPLPKVARGRVLAEWVTASLRQAVLSGHFEPGERIDQDRIAEEFEISRTPVREALRQLEAGGFVEIRPHYGAFIAMVSQQGIKDIYDARRLLEVEIVRQVAPILPADVLEELDATLPRETDELDPKDAASHFASDAQFHSTLASFAENQVLRELLEGLNNRISMVRCYGQMLPGRHLVESAKEHRQILSALQEQDASKAAQQMAIHLERSSVRLQKLEERRTES
jgi:DNA-binding GntR family transcriptional regulator